MAAPMVNAVAEEPILVPSTHSSSRCLYLQFQDIQCLLFGWVFLRQDLYVVLAVLYSSVD